MHGTNNAIISDQANASPLLYGRKKKTKREGGQSQDKLLASYKQLKYSIKPQSEFTQKFWD